jgi:hypothetical protein
MLGAIMCLVAMLIALGAADINIAGVAIPLMLYDCGAQLFVVSNGYRVAGLDAKARARLNSCVLLFMFMGQVRPFHRLKTLADSIDNWNGNLDQDLRCQRMESNRRNCSWICICYGALPPSQVSTHPYLSSSCDQELMGRGPHEERWFGWRGGRELLRRPAMVDLSPEALTEGPLHQERGGDGKTSVETGLGVRDSEAVGEGGGKIGTGLDPARS